MTTVVRRVVVAFALSVLVVGAVGVSSCSGDSGDSGTNPGLDLIQDVGYGVDASPPDAGVTEDTWVKPDGQLPVDVDFEGEGTLEFVDRFGDGGVSCVATNRCPKTYTSIEIRPLQVRYLLDGVRQPGVAIGYEITRGPDGIADLQPANGIAVTDENGEATIELRVLEFAEDEGLAQLEVTARVPSRPDVPPLYFDVLIDVKGPDQPPLTVLPDYTGAQPVDSVKVKLFRQPRDTRNEGQYVITGLTCEDLVTYVRNDNEIRMPPATVLSAEIEIGQSFAFQEVHFDDLPNDPEQMYTIVAVGQDANRVNRIVGCDDERGLVRFGESRTVIVSMIDLPPRLKGVYEVHSEFDLISALPDDVENVVNIVIGFFQSPSTTVMELLCLINSSVTDDLCGFVFLNDGSISATGSIIVSILDGIIRGLGQGNAWGTILEGGGDVGLILKQFTVLSTITFDEEPDVTGWIDERSTDENWYAFRYRWALGVPGCVADPDCGWEELSFSSIGLSQVIQGQFMASVNTVQEGNNAPYTLLTVVEHPLNVRYGALINQIIKRLVLPRLAGGEPPDGLPPVDDYEKLIKSILAGRECLDDERFGGPLCCETFADNILGATNIPMAQSLVISACGALVDFGSQYIENLLLGLDLQTGDPNADNAFLIGTMPDAPCKLYDVNNDLEIDNLGRSDRPCAWQATIRVALFGGLDVYIDANFWGSRQ